MAPPRLHANLLFYGLDEGTWSDPPVLSDNTDGPASKGRFWGCTGVGKHAPASHSSQTSDDLAVMATIKALWDNSGNCSADGGSDVVGVNTSPAVVAEPSTDEGSETKGSESDSLPESNEGYLMPTLGPQQLTDSMPSTTRMLPYMQPLTSELCGVGGLGMVVPPHSAMLAEAAALYSSYLPPGGYIAPHGFGGGDSDPPYTYEAAAPNFLATAAVVGGTVATGGPDGVPSIGSYAHLSGQCSRCCFHPKGRCANGYSCQFCHFDHDKRPRNGKKKRYRHQPDDIVDENGED